MPEPFSTVLKTFVIQHSVEVPAPKPGEARAAVVAMTERVKDDLEALGFPRPNEQNLMPVGYVGPPVEVKTFMPYGWALAQAHITVMSTEDELRAALEGMVP
jgi:hypothetical protein